MSLFCVANNPNICAILTYKTVPMAIVYTIYVLYNTYMKSKYEPSVLDWSEGDVVLVYAEGYTKETKRDRRGNKR